MCLVSGILGWRGPSGPSYGPAVLALAGFLIAACPVLAEPALSPMLRGVPVTVECIDDAARAQQVPREILYAIGVVEGGKVGEIAHNANGSYDIGVFQINSHWLGLLARAYGTDPATVEYHLLWNGCFSAAMAAWVLHKKILEVGGDFWRGVGNYNSANPPFHDHYLGKVVSRVRLLLRDR